MNVQNLNTQKKTTENQPSPERFVTQSRKLPQRVRVCMLLCQLLVVERFPQHFLVFRCKVPEGKLKISISKSKMLLLTTFKNATLQSLQLPNSKLNIKPSRPPWRQILIEGKNRAGNKTRKQGLWKITYHNENFEFYLSVISVESDRLVWQNKLILRFPRVLYSMNYSYFKYRQCTYSSSAGEENKEILV